MALKLAAAVAITVLGLGSLARAEQFVLVDESYTHSTDTTDDSHYYPELPADTPKNWEQPIDYAGGSVHIVLDVKTKPAGDAPTRLQICFEATPSYACTEQSPVYTKAGPVEWDSPFDGFWYESTVDWAQGIKKSPLILKDDMNNKPAGDPKYMPTDLRVQVILVSKGATFVPPPAAGSSAGSGGDTAGSGGVGSGSAGAGGASAGAEAGSEAVGGASGRTEDPAGAGGQAAAGEMAAAPSGTAGAAGAVVMDAGVSRSETSPAAGATSNGPQAGSASSAQEASSGGCRVTGDTSDAGWLPWAVAAYWATRRRKARSQA